MTSEVYESYNTLSILFPFWIAKLGTEFGYSILE